MPITPRARLALYLILPLSALLLGGGYFLKASSSQQRAAPSIISTPAKIVEQDAMQSFKVVESVSKHTGTVIFLHGLGDSGTSFIPFAKGLQQKHPHLKWVIPTAKSIPITANGGMTMPAWFDIPDISRISNSQYDDERGMLNSVRAVEGLIAREIEDHHIPSERIVVGGFSQGCVVSVLTALCTERKLGGVIALSGWVPLSHKIEELIGPTANDLAIFWGHGTQDSVVPFHFGQASSRLLQKMTKSKLPLLTKGETFARPGLRFESYEGVGHSLAFEEVEQISDWLAKAVPQ